jgi:predicted GIY-YIG superfamily endonuclease
MAAWVYILRCSDKSYYIGSTSDLRQRIWDHESGKFGGYTSSRRPVKLIWTNEFQTIREAIEAERRLKKWGRKKKEALMEGNFELLHQLARSSSTRRKLKFP